MNFTALFVYLGPMIGSSLILLLELLVALNSSTQKADLAVTSVSIAGKPNAYSFSVGIQSADTGCEQYADWWEVLTPTGDLIYRRILQHSHVEEQPFIRSGGPIAINENTEVIVRGHMNTSGYGEVAFQGTVKNGFKMKTLPKGFAFHLAKKTPLPDGCAF